MMDYIGSLTTLLAVVTDRSIACADIIEPFERDEYEQALTCAIDADARMVSALQLIQEMSGDPAVERIASEALSNITGAGK